MFGRKRGQFESELVEFAGLVLNLPRFGLVRCDENGLTNVAEEKRDLLIERRHAGSGIYDPNDRLCTIDRERRLLEDIGRNDRLVIRHYPARVNQLESLRFPLHIAVDAVTRDPRLIADNRLPTAGKPVKKGRLAHVRAADDCYERFLH